MTLLSGKISQYEFLTGKPKIDLLEKAATINRFEYSPLSSELKSKTGIAKERHIFFKRSNKC